LAQFSADRTRAVRQVHLVEHRGEDAVGVLAQLEEHSAA